MADRLRDLEEAAYRKRQLAKRGSAFWEHEAQKAERELYHAEMGDDLDDLD